MAKLNDWMKTHGPSIVGLAGSIAVLFDELAAESVVDEVGAVAVLVVTAAHLVSGIADAFDNRND